MDQVISLYKEEIAAYQQQVDDLKQRNRECDSKNVALIGKVRELEDLIEKVNVANQDLNSAFEHVHQENLRLQMGQPGNQDALTLSNPNKQLQVAESHSKNDNQLASESLVWISERDQFKQRNKFLERECERYHRDNIHLGKQVRHLLKTLEEERGMIIRHQSQVAPDDRVMCAADVIDKHLITFESIEELQQQNQKLLSLVKNLSAEQEEREVRVESEEVKRLTADLEDLKSQLDTVKSERERVLNLLKTIHKERDLFSILLSKTRQVEHMTPEIFKRMVAVACSSGPAIADTESASKEREAHIDDLKKMISNLEHDLATIKTELEDSRTSSAAELKLKNELLEKAHIRISEVLQQQEAITERNQLLESNLQALTTEFDEIRTKCQKMTFELDEANKKAEVAESLNQDLNKTLELERKRCQDAIIEVSQMREQTQQLLESLEREKQARQQELATIFNDIQERQMRELEERTKKQVELQIKLSNTERDLETLKAQMTQAIQEKEIAAARTIGELESKLAHPVKDLAAEARIKELETRLANQATDGAALAKIRELEQRLASQSAQQPSDLAAQQRIRELETRLASIPKNDAAEQRVLALEAKLAEQDATLASRIKDLEDLSAKYTDLQQRLSKAQSDVFKMQEERNREREGRLKLDRMIHTCPRKGNIRMKYTMKRKRVRFGPDTRATFNPDSDPSIQNLEDHQECRMDEDQHNQTDQSIETISAHETSSSDMINVTSQSNGDQSSTVIDEQLDESRQSSHVVDESDYSVEEISANNESTIIDNSQREVYQDNSHNQSDFDLQRAAIESSEYMIDDSNQVQEEVITEVQPLEPAQPEPVKEPPVVAPIKLKRRNYS